MNDDKVSSESPTSTQSKTVTRRAKVWSVIKSGPMNRYFLLAAFLLTILLMVFLILSLIQEINFNSSQLLALAGVITLFTILAYPANVEELRFGLMGAKFRKVEKQFEQLTAEVDALNFAIRSLLTRWEVEHLKKLRFNADDEVENHESLRRELVRLEHLNYLRPRNGNSSTFESDLEKAGDKFRLREYAEITQTGLQYLKLIENPLGRDADTSSRVDL
ncbi:hypothetical protein [Streptomyces sp. NPDC056387]|uniref:hypothetical protein n=1 Tax=Streptomyces sp. NPDC056387 TaxID=3345803 RepID=UPI0035DDB4F2